MADKPRGFSSLLAGKPSDAAKPAPDAKSALVHPAPGAESTPVQPTPAQATPDAEIAPRIDSTPAQVAPAQPAPPAESEATAAHPAPGAHSTPPASIAPAPPAPGADFAPGAGLTPIPDRPAQFEMVEFTRVPHAVVDGRMSHLSPTVRCVYLMFLRLTMGSNRPTCQISIRGIADREGIGERTAQVAVKALVASGYIERVVLVTEHGAADPMGMTYRVYLPPGVGFTPASTAPGAKSAPPARTAPVQPANMKETPKRSEKDLVKFEIRKTALRLFGTAGPVDLDVLRIALTGQGIEWDDVVVRDAVDVIGRTGD